MIAPRRLALMLGAVVCALGLALWARQGTDFAQIGDPAVIESYTWMASKGHLFLGPYSRFQWHHPGPLYFFWMVPFYVLSGARPAGLGAAALMLNVSMLLAMTTILVRRATGEVAIATMAIVAAYSWRVGPMLTSAWNPHVTVFAALVLIIASADTVSGVPRTLPIVAVLASLVGQSHVGLLPTAVALGIIATAGTILPQNGRMKPEAARALILTTVLLIVVWIPSIVEELRGHPGNISQLWTFFVKESHRGQPWSMAFSAWSSTMSSLLRRDFSIPVGARVRPNAFRWAGAVVAVQVIGLAAACAVAIRARRGFEAALAGLLLLVSVLALWSATRIEETIFDHEVFWMSAVGILNMAVVASLIARPFTERRIRSAGFRPMTAAVCWTLFAWCAVIGLFDMRSVVSSSHNISNESQAVSDVAEELRAYLGREAVGRPLIRIDQDAWPLAAGVILRLQKDGVPVAVEDDWIAMFTPQFAATGRERLELAIDGKAQHVRSLGQPGDAVVIDHDPVLFVHRITR